MDRLLGILECFLLLLFFKKFSVITKNTQKKKCIRGNDYSSSLYIDDKYYETGKKWIRIKKHAFWAINTFPIDNGITLTNLLYQ